MNTEPDYRTGDDTYNAYQAAIDAISRIAYPEEDHT